jgi:hypothetical protein
MGFQKITLCILFLSVLFTSCNLDKDRENSVEAAIDSIQKQYAPDKRVALFQIDAVKQGQKTVLKGESNLPEAVTTLHNVLDERKIDFIDSIQLLPTSELADETQAVVNISVANLRSNPKHAAELATQATLGTPVKVLKKEGSWYYIQTPDKYLSWVDAGGITLMNPKRFEEWRSHDKIIFKKTYGHSYNAVDEEEIISDLVAGNVLEFVKNIDGFFVVSYPDGRLALVRDKEAEDYSGWLQQMNPTTDDLVATSKTLMGVPYLWGGTSTKGMDCSGFTKTVYFLNGMVIPRDASQQVHTGKPIDSVGNFENLERGDLLFFGRKATDSTAEKVVHVGMWIGNNEFIHASEMVRISSMDLNAENYDKFNRDRYLRTKRILKETDEGLINLAQTPVFKD